MKTEPLSKCCNSTMTTVGIPDFGDGSPEDVSTCYFQCDSCKMPADTKPMETSDDLVNCGCCEEDAKEHICRFNDGEQKCECYEAGRVSAIDIPEWAYDLGFKEGRASIMNEFVLFGEPFREQKSQDEMKKQFNQE